MSLRLVSRAADPHRFVDHAVSRLRLAPLRKAVAGAGPRRRPLLSDAAFVEDPRDEAFSPDALGSTEPSPDHGPDQTPDLALDRSADHAPDYAAARAQAEAEDLALVRLAASRLAVALRELSTLLRGDRGSRRSDALARCTSNGWITLQGDPWSASQTFRVTPEGYRAAGLRVPPFAA